MSTPLSLIAQGSFVSTGAQRVVQLPKYPHYFEIFNRSTWGTAPTAVVKSWWYDGYANGQASHLTEGGGSALTATATAAGGAGFTLIDTSSQTPGALVAVGTQITAANPAVVSDASAVGTAPVVGDIVRMINTTTMLQIAGMDFTVTATTPGVDYTLGYMDASGVNFVAATNADFRIIPAKYYTPYRRFITGITAAANAVVTVSVAHNYLVGDWVTLHIPAVFGTMVHFDNTTARITAVTASTMTLNLNTTGYAFVWPNSATFAAGASHACVTNVGEVATKLTSAMDNSSQYDMQIGTAVVGANTNVMDWVAYARDV